MLEKVPCGLVVRIWRFHRHGQRSNSGMGNSRLCRFYFIIKQVKKPVFNAIVRHHFLQLQTSKLCRVHRLHNFNNNCYVVLISTTNVVQWLGSGALTAKARVRFPAWEIYRSLVRFPSSLKIREMVHLVYKSSIFVEFNAQNLVSSGAGNILTIILIQLLCCWDENFSLLERNENFRKERFNFTASVYYPRFDVV